MLCGMATGAQKGHVLKSKPSEGAVVCLCHAVGCKKVIASNAGPHVQQQEDEVTKQCIRRCSKKSYGHEVERGSPTRLCPGEAAPGALCPVMGSSVREIVKY